MGRYVVIDVNPANKVILGGPYLWDGETQWEPPEQGDLMIEADALTGGWTYPPPPPPPAVPWVAVDFGTMTITGGPWDWNGQDAPPAEGDLMTESDALTNGYTYP